MEFKKYQHIERLNTTETDGITLGECYVFPKIDGTNASVWLKDNEEIGCGSRNRVLSLDNDNQGFMAWALNNNEIKAFLKDNPRLRLYGEWLVPHTLKTYYETAWRNFYIFDVQNNEGRYLSYPVYSELLSNYGIEFIPPICKIENPTEERLYQYLDENKYLVQDGKGVGEGIVIKNYDYKNKFGRQIWAKIVRNEFKANHSKDVRVVKDKKQVEFEITEKYVTKVLVEKEYAKIVNEAGWSSRMIPRLLNTVYYSLVKEESWNFVKEHKNPKIDFKRLVNLTFAKVKELKPKLF
jgi:hypothetical protein